MTKRKQKKDVPRKSEKPHIINPAPKCSYKHPISKVKSGWLPPRQGHVWRSISHILFIYFDKVGCDNAVYDECLELAKQVLPTTKFSAWHMYYYRKLYRTLITEKMKAILMKKLAKIKEKKHDG